MLAVHSVLANAAMNQQNEFMAIINRHKAVAYSAAQMYALVNDVESYPDFVPWCISSDVHSRTEDEVRATLTFARGGLQKSFTTLNRLQANRMIEIRLIDGPFHHLEGFWRFEELDSGQCRVALDLEFEFTTHLLSMMFGPLFQQIANTLVDSFCARAEVVYAAAND